ncbi:MAG TPA: helix-turn-helix-type transcriptional regulator [Cytophagales bacterium]|jgi:MerR family transcriptional regulator, light-induced transcriptional regulator|nr:helix-turn-helix-type transcriptional regulator [Cytophagales bacterium]
MSEYSIKELEKLSGIKAHTIRIWEKRYKLISPKRTSTNIRLYSDNDLKKIINISVVNNSGVKISHIAKLTSAKLNELVQGKSSSGEDMASPIDKLVLATAEMNEQLFCKCIDTLEASHGFENVVVHVLYPFLQKLGVLWHTGEITPAQEHFVSNLIRQKLIAAIDRLPLPRGKSKKTILFLPENEQHEIGLLFANYIARKKGHLTYYLGQSVPYKDLKQVVTVHQPDVLITSIVTSLNDDNLEVLLKNLSHDFKKQLVLISGLAVRQFDFSKFKNIRHFDSADMLKSLL